MLAAAWAVLLASLPAWAGKLAAWADWGVVALVAVLGFVAALAPVALARPSKLDWPWLMLAVALILAGMSAVTSVCIYDSLRLLLLLSAALGSLVLSRALAQGAGWVGWGLGAGALVTGLWGLREWAWAAASGDPSWRPFAGFLNPNAMAGYLLVALPAAAAVTHDLRKVALDKPPGHPARVAYPLVAIFALASGGAMLLTASKGGFLGALVAAVGTVLLRGGRRRLALLAAVAILAGTGFAVPSLRSRVKAALAAEKGTSIAFRAKTWAGTLDMARARVFFGWGPGSFRHAYPRFARVAFTQMAHSSWLQWWAESGLFSAVALVAGLGGLIGVLATRPGPWAAAAVFSLLGLLAHNAVDYTWYMAPTMVSALALVGVALGLGERPDENRAPSGWRRRHPAFLAMHLAVAASVAGVATWFLAAERQAVAADRAWGSGLVARAADMARAAARRAAFSGDLWVKVGKMEEGRAGLPPSEVHLKAAAEAYKTAAGRCPTDPAGYIGAARCLRLAGQAKEAVLWGCRGAEVYPRGPVALVEYARCLEAAGRTKDAVEVYRRAMALADQDYGRCVPLSGWADYHLAIAAAAVARSGAAASEKLQAWRVAGKVLVKYLQWSAAYAPALLIAGRGDAALRDELRSLALEAAAALKHSAEIGDRQLAARLAALGGS